MSPWNAARSNEGSILDRLMKRLVADPDTFVCGIAEAGADGSAPTGFRYRRVWVDPYRDDGIVRVRLGPTEGFRVRLADPPWGTGTGPQPRRGYATLVGADVDRGTPLHLAVPAAQLERFGFRLP